MTKKVSHALVTTGVILFLSLSGMNARQRLSAGAGRGVATDAGISRTLTRAIEGRANFTCTVTAFIRS
jgi:hypothetical protein